MSGSTAKLMGILNVTPDSFYDGGIHFYFEDAIRSALEMVESGVDIIDIGGESTRPGSATVPEEEELRRVVPIIEELKKHFNVPLSIDTRKPTVAQSAAAAGASYLNDISGFEDPQMREVAKTHNVHLIVMHMQGTPQTMQENPCYPEGIIEHLLDWFKRKIDQLLDSGINSSRIILDPGIGFGKTIQHNLEIIHAIPQLKKLGFPILLGISRKSFIRKILNKPTSELLPATLSINTMALLGGVDFIRVHDVSAHRDVIDLLSHMQSKKSI